MLSGLGIHTEAGKETLKQEQRAYELLRQYGDFEIAETDKSKPIRYDATIRINGKSIALLETKCRNATIEQFDNWGSLLITLHKIEGCRHLARKMGVPFFLLIYSVPSDRILLKQVTDKSGEFCFDFSCSRIITQNNCHGNGQKREMNMFVPILQPEWSEVGRSVESMLRGGEDFSVWL